MDANNPIPQDENSARQDDALQSLWEARGERPGELLAPGAQLSLLVAPRRALSRMIAAAAARLCLTGPVHVLDGGNLYDAHVAARMLRLLTPQPDAGLRRIHIAPAFTCYQVEALLAARPSGPDPLLALDLLDTFADENVPPAHRDYLAQRVRQHLLRLAQHAVTLAAVAPADTPPLRDYIDWLAQASARVLRLEGPQPPAQWRLF